MLAMSSHAASRLHIIPGLAVLALGALAAPASAQVLDTDLNRWMDFVDDSASLANLTIPGSHDSGARFEPISGTAICQNLAIGDQLESGVRYLDIRLRQIDNALVVHHGAIYQHLNFDDVLGQVVGFLRAHPSETVIMEVSSEYDPSNNTESYEQTFLRYVANPSYHDFWWRDGAIPTLGEVRGKIVLLRRFAGSAVAAGGIDVTGWQDNAQFTLADARGQAIVVQDIYKVSLTTNDNKWNAITSVFGQAVNDTRGTWYVNFTSGVRSFLGIPSIPGVSNDINNRLFNFFQTSPLHQVHDGTIVSDFVSKSLIQQELSHYFD